MLLLQSLAEIRPRVRQCLKQIPCLPIDLGNAEKTPIAQALIGRQPILDRDLDVFGYELLFRPGKEISQPLNGESATSEVVNNAFVDFGLDRIVGGHRAFINVTRDFLLQHSELPFPKDRVVLELLEDVDIDTHLIDAIRTLSDAGYVPDCSRRSACCPTSPSTKLSKSCPEHNN